MTESREFAKILTKLGHSISYHITEETETQFTSSLSEESAVTQENIIRF